MKKILLTITVLVFINLNSQNNNDFSPAIHSPQISAFAKFSEFPISLYTGQAEISVPIYNMQVGDIAVPISLQYHTGGVRVEDLATWIGMNWSLKAGGQITRQINGLPDFSKDWFFRAPLFTLADSSNTPQGNTINENFKNIHRSGTGLKDSEHDFYYYSAGNFSGKFIIDHNNEGRIVTFPKDDVDISDNFIEKKITTPDGLTYIYGVGETNNQSNWCTGTGVFPANFNAWEPLAWFLTRIESSTTGAFVDFVYESKKLVYDQNGAVTINEDLPFNTPAPTDSECTIKNEISTHRLASIKSSDGQIVTFNKGAERKDLFGDYLLDNIVVSNTNSSKTKQYKLKHKYQRQSDFHEINDPFFNSLITHDEAMRLFLMSVDEVSEDNAIIPLAEFTYNLSHGLPSRRSYAQDHFGYYNGKNNSTIVSKAYINGDFYPGADRTPNLNYAKQGSLASMRTSTGGVRNYTYGINRCSGCNSRDINPPTQATYITKSTNDFTIPSQGSSPIILEKTFYTAGQSDLVFRYEGHDEAFYHRSANVEAKLFKLNADGSMHSIIFNSTTRREEIEFRNDGTSFLIINYENYINRGDYKLELIIHDLDWWHELHDYDENNEFVLSVRREVQGESTTSTTPGDFEIGGLRIEAMELYDPMKDDTISRSYVYGSGYLNSFSRYYRNAKKYDANNLGNYIRRSSSPNIPFSKTKSGVVGYSSVTVNELGNGSIVNKFFSPLDYQDRIYNEPAIGGYPTFTVSSMGDLADLSDNEWNYPFALKDEKDWKRGLLKNQIFFNEEGDIVKKIENKYHFYDDVNHDSYDPSKINTIYGIRSGSEALGSNYGGLLQFYYYQLQSSWYDIDEVIETNYFEGGRALTTTTKYKYNSNQRTVESTSIANSKGEETVIQTNYPQDQIDQGEDTDGMMAKLVAQHRIAEPVKTNT
ncbi:hypothetical protein OAC51_09635, partial [Flavobacteriaceae bacterium]|nr:hypothetical protein [Flavobacteriaceae bacterium]